MNDCYVVIFKGFFREIFTILFWFHFKKEMALPPLLTSMPHRMLILIA